MALFRFPKRKMRKLVQQGEYEEAISFGKRIEARFLGDADFMFMMGSVYYLVEDAKNAVLYFDRTLELRPGDAEALLLKARIHAHTGDMDEARRCCARALEIEPENEAAKELFDSI